MTKASTSSSITLDAPAPHLGDTIRFTVHTSAKNPRVNLNAYQNGVLVWGCIGLPADSYKLGGDASDWLTNGGNAELIAELVDLEWVHKVEQVTHLAVCTFTAEG